MHATTPRSLWTPSVATAMLALMAACPSDPESTHDNPRTLWLALDGSETQVRLLPAEPAPF